MKIKGLLKIFAVLVKFLKKIAQKKKVIIVMLSLLYCGSLCAEPLDLQGKLGNWGFTFRTKTGVVLSLQRDEEEWTACELFEVWKKWGLSVNGGWAYESEAIAAIQYDLTYIMKMDEVPLLSPEVGIYYGYDFDREETDYGVVMTLISVDF